MKQPERSHPRARTRSVRTARRLSVGVLTTGLATSALITAPAVTTEAADEYSIVDTMQCISPSTDVLYKIDSTKGLVARKITSIRSSDVAFSGSAWTASSSSLWKGYTKVFGGGQSRIYAIDTTNSTTAKRGLYMWTESGTTVSSPVQIDTSLAGSSFTKWSSAKNNLITSDASGDIYTLTDGLLRRFVVDASARKIVRYQHLAGVEWKDYDLIAAAGSGALYARTAPGVLYRYQLERASERWIGTRKKVGSSGWQNMASIVSPLGGDLITVSTSGAVREYTWLGEGGSYLGSTQLAASGWTGAKVLTTVERCTPISGVGPRPLETFSSTSTSTPLPQNAAASVLRAQGTPGSPTALKFAFTTNAGTIFSVNVPDSTALDVLDPPIQASDDDSYYAGSPTYVGDPERGATLLGRRVDPGQEDHIGRGFASATDGSWSWADKLGLFADPVSAVQVTSRAMAVFGVDINGDLWVSESLWKANSSGTNVPLAALGAWRKLPLPGGGAIQGEVSTVALAGSGSGAAVVARAANGRLYAATYSAATETGVTFSAWTLLPDAPATISGKPSLTVAPGNLLRVAARTTSGDLITLGQTPTGFPDSWTTVSENAATIEDTPYSLAGDPTVVYNPADGRVTLFSRTSDGSILAWQETNMGCNTFSPGWAVTSVPNNFPALVSDPVAFLYSIDGAYNWGVASYDSQFRLTLLYRTDTTTTTPSTGCAAPSDGSVSSLGARGSEAAPRFNPPTFEKSVAAAPNR